VATGGCKYGELEQHRADWTVADLSQIHAREICLR
jgi:phosphoglycolate phosphatase-like HAD superfamily hydrolase